MTLIEAFQLQVIFAILVAIHHLIMCYFQPERKLNIFEDDPSGLIILVVVWFGFITILRYYFQMPLIGWMGYLI